ncbi:uncharacterized protein [Palaemon carinicauda]|uniref:uncharacterized protein n=1 Tax=Palaemon carinicauda TaxID=392227 RepID=UPI0035B674BD
MAETNHKQGSKRVRLYLDTGSLKSFISVKTARQLGLLVVGRVELNIATFGSAEISGQYDVVSCRVEIGRRVVRMKLVPHENLEVPIHNTGYVQVRQHLLSKGVTLADLENKSDELKNVHILVAADYFSYFIIGIEKVDGISLFLTHNVMSPYGKFDVDEWWCLDHVGITPSEQYTVLEAEAIRKVSQSVVKKPEGYQVSLPFGSDARPDTNYRNAVAQLESLQTKFRKDREYFDRYQGLINKYLEAGFISEVKEPKIEGYYMPHFGIKKDSCTTPLRIVFNASAKSKGHKSLNECLLPGPHLVELAYHLLMRFRLNEYAMPANIS